jgi:uroporphyrinogen III methyltransferase / synthase
MSRGEVFLVGAGPGAPGLLTLRAADVLRQAQVVIYDGLVSREVLKLAPPDAEVIYAGKHDRNRCVSQEEINSLLLNHARAGKRVVRLKGGDPYLFGRGGEEAELLAAAGILFEVVPGVSAVQAVPACAGIPLTHRQFNSCLTVVTGHETPDSPGNKLDWAHLARTPGTLVVMMGLRNLRSITAALIAHGRAADSPAAVISRGSTPHQRTVTGTLSTIAGLAEEMALPAPAMLVIGEVVRLRDQLDWFERRSLVGRRIVVTQRPDLAQPLISALQARGADVLAIPATHWSLPADPGPMDQAMDRLDAYDWILFSNPVGVDFFLSRLLERHHDLRRLGPAKLGTYGPVTGERLRHWRLCPIAIAADHKTPLIMEAVLRCGSVCGQKFLVLRGEHSTERVPEALAKEGAIVDVVPCFRTEPELSDYATEAKRFADEGADWLLFASGLGIEHFNARFNLPALARSFPNLQIAIASESINWALSGLDLKPAVIALPDNLESLLGELEKAEAERRQETG